MRWPKTSASCACCLSAITASFLSTSRGFGPTTDHSPRFRGPRQCRLAAEQPYLDVDVPFAVPGFDEMSALKVVGDEALRQPSHATPVHRHRLQDARCAVNTGSAFAFSSA